MAKPRPEQKSAKCRGWNELCSCIRNNHPDLKVKINNRQRTINYPNLKIFLQQKGLIEANGEPSLKCFEAQWIFSDSTSRLTHEGKVFETVNSLVVSSYGYDKIVRLLQGKRVKFPKEKQVAKTPDLTVKQIDRLKNLQIVIKSNIKDYVIVGANLLEIQKLLGIKGRRLGEYTQKHFGFDYPRALQYMRAVETVCSICKTTPDALKVYRGSAINGQTSPSLPRKPSKIKPIRSIYTVPSSSKKKESILDMVNRISPASKSIGDALQLLDSERKVRSLVGLTVNQQRELVDRLISIQNENSAILTESDIRRYTEQCKAGIHSESDLARKKIQFELTAIRHRLKRLTETNGTSDKWQRAIDSIDALIEKPSSKVEDPF